MDIDKKKVLYISGILNIIVFVIILINIVIVFPITAENVWIYGIYIIAAGLVVYFLGLFLVSSYYFEFIGTIMTIVGEMFILSYFAIFFPVWGEWISNFIIFPSITFFAMMIIAYYFGKDDLENKKAINYALMGVSASFFIFMIEAAIRIPNFFNSTHVPIWAWIIIVGGLMLYAFTTWKLYDRPSYIMALTGAFIVNIGVIMLELFYQLHIITGIYTLLFLPPVGVFFLLIFINYEVSEKK